MQEKKKQPTNANTHNEMMKMREKELLSGDKKQPVNNKA